MSNDITQERRDLWRKQVDHLLSLPHLTDWETEFVTDLDRQLEYADLTWKQSKRLRELFDAES